METHWAPFRRGNVEHVLRNSVTGEAALAGQGAERVLGEPCSLTKDMEHVVWDFTPFFCFIIHIFIFTLHYFLPPVISLFSWMHTSTINKTAWSLFSREFIMSYFPIHIIPLNMLQAVSQSFLPTSLTDIHPAT